MLLSELKIFSFNKSFDLKNFDCGVTILNDYLVKYASQDLKRYLTSIYICSPEDQKEVIGYYTLSSNRIDVSEISKDYTKKLPCYPGIANQSRVSSLRATKGFVVWLGCHS